MGPKSSALFSSGFQSQFDSYNLRMLASRSANTAALACGARARGFTSNEMVRLDEAAAALAPPPSPRVKASAAGGTEANSRALFPREISSWRVSGAFVFAFVFNFDDFFFPIPRTLSGDKLLIRRLSSHRLSRARIE